MLGRHETRSGRAHRRASPPPSPCRDRDHPSSGGADGGGREGPPSAADARAAGPRRGVVLRPGRGLCAVRHVLRPSPRGRRASARTTLRRLRHHAHAHRTRRGTSELPTLLPDRAPCPLRWLRRRHQPGAGALRRAATLPTLHEQAPRRERRLRELRQPSTDRLPQPGGPAVFNVSELLPAGHLHGLRGACALFVPRQRESDLQTLLRQGQRRHLHDLRERAAMPLAGNRARRLRAVLQPSPALRELRGGPAAPQAHRRRLRLSLLGLRSADHRDLHKLRRRSDSERPDRGPAVLPALLSPPTGVVPPLHQLRDHHTADREALPPVAEPIR